MTVYAFRVLREKMKAPQQATQDLLYIQEKEKHIYKNLCTNAHSSIIHNGLKAETTQMSISDIATQWI